VPDYSWSEKVPAKVQGILERLTCGRGHVGTLRIGVPRTGAVQHENEDLQRVDQALEHLIGLFDPVCPCRTCSNCRFQHHSLFSIQPIRSLLYNVLWVKSAWAAPHNANAGRPPA